MAEPSVASEKHTANPRRAASTLVSISVAVLVALAFRVISGCQAVFPANYVSFQEPDAWFHMRTIHNLLAHFPFRSGFDPYALFPAGQNITTAPFWDYFVATIAWLCGLGSPSARAIDEVGAWLPAIIGAIFPVPVFFLTRRLFDQSAALLAAIWVALIPGTFLWVSHLGMADHHAAEILTSFLTLTFLCAAAELTGIKRWTSSVIAGVFLGAFLTTRAAGIFVPAVLAAASLLSLELAPLAALTLAVACLLIFPAHSASPWAQYTWLSLIEGLAITGPLAVLNRLRRDRGWNPFLRDTLALLIAALATAWVWLVEGDEIRSLKTVIQRHTPGQPGAELAAVVRELQPLWTSSPGGFKSAFAQFGYGWILAMPALFAILWIALRARRPALTLFALWSAVMMLGSVLQLRMAAYAGFIVAILAGAATAWISRRLRNTPIAARFAVAIALLAASAGLPAGYAQTGANEGPDRDWSAALNWLRWHTPEPMGNGSSWSAWQHALTGAEHFRYPATAYGIMVPWDRGWWISGMARRIPLANGEGKGALDTSRFVTETDPAEALHLMTRNAARYAVIAPEQITYDFRSFAALAGRDVDRYSREFYVQRPGRERVPVRLFFPAYFRAMGPRLYVFDGHAVKASRGVQVFISSVSVNAKGQTENTVQSIKLFPAQQEAEQWINAHPMETATLASDDPSATCVDLEEIPWLKKVFASNNDPLIAGRQPAAVKIFERVIAPRNVPLHR